MLAVAEAPPTAAVVERLMAVAAVLTAIVKINKISAFRKWLAPFKRGGPFAFSILGPSQSKTLRNSLCACGLNK
jgi:hypothetical protein